MKRWLYFLWIFLFSQNIFAQDSYYPNHDHELDRGMCVINHVQHAFEYALIDLKKTQDWNHSQQQVVKVIQNYVDEEAQEFTIAEWAGLGLGGAITSGGVYLSFKDVEIEKIANRAFANYVDLILNQQYKLEKPLMILLEPRLREKDFFQKIVKGSIKEPYMEPIYNVLVHIPETRANVLLYEDNIEEVQKLQKIWTENEHELLVEEKKVYTKMIHNARELDLWIENPNNVVILRKKIQEKFGSATVERLNRILDNASNLSVDYFKKLEKLPTKVRLSIWSGIAVVALDILFHEAVTAKRKPSKNLTETDIARMDSPSLRSYLEMHHQELHELIKKAPEVGCSTKK